MPGCSLGHAGFAWVSDLWRLVNLGKTLNLGGLQLFALEAASTMYSLISLIVRFLPSAQGVAPVNGVAHNLMERAESRAGRHPRQAQELRNAALAYLSVIR